MTKDRDAKMLSLCWYALGVLVLTITCAMNYRWGGSLALSEDAKLLIGGASLLMDAAVIMFAAFTGWAWNNKKGVKWLALASLVLFTSWSAASVFGFQASERIAKARYLERSQAAAEAQIKAANAQAAADRKEQIEWLRSTWREERGKERQRLLGEVRQAVKDRPNLEAAPVVTTMADAQASVFALVTGYDPNNILVFMVTLASVAFVYLKAMCFFFGGYAWPRSDVNPPAPPVAKEEPPLVETKEEPKPVELQPVAQEVDNVTPLAPAAAATRRVLVDPILQAKVNEATKPSVHAVHNFLECGVARVSGASIGERVFYELYRRYVHLHGGVLVGLREFKRILKAKFCVVAQKDERGRSVFVGWQPQEGFGDAKIA